MELAILPSSGLEGRSASDLLLRTRYGLNLLAVSRQGQRSRTRLRAMPLQAGDLLLMQGPLETIAEFASDNGCVPLAERELHIPSQRKAWQAGGIMLLSVGAAALGWLPAAIAFALGVLASMVLRTVSPRAVYEAVDWPVVVLLAALMPVAGAMETTGTADLIARFMLDHLAQGNAIVGLGLILVVTMFLSDLMNNAATAAVMCPIALGTASALGASADPFLMAVAIGASCAFLTPIGHQNNTLILGPGGFRFGDYWRLGVPLEVLVVAISMPVLLLAMAELQFASGAKEVLPVHEMAQPYTSWAQAQGAIAALPMKPLLTKVVSAHVMGGCGMAGGEAQGVVRADGGHWQIENLSVHDGSIFPTSVGANPQLSIYGITNRLAQGLVQRLTGASEALA